MSSKKIALCQVFLLLTLGSYDNYGNKHSRSPCRLHFILGMIECNGLLKGCIDISHQVKAIEVVLKRLLLLIHGPLSAI